MDTPVPAGRYAACFYIRAEGACPMTQKRLVLTTILATFASTGCGPAEFGFTDPRLHSSTEEEGCACETPHPPANEPSPFPTLVPTPTPSVSPTPTPTPTVTSKPPCPAPSPAPDACSLRVWVKVQGFQ